MTEHLDESLKTIGLTGTVSIFLKIRSLREKIEQTQDLTTKIDLLAHQNELKSVLIGLAIASSLRNGDLASKIVRWSRHAFGKK